MDRKAVKLLQGHILLGHQPKVCLKAGHYAGSIVTALSYVKTYERTRRGMVHKVRVDLGDHTAYYYAGKLKVVDFEGKAAVKINLDPEFVANLAARKTEHERTRITAQPKDIFAQRLAIEDYAVSVMGGNFYRIIDIWSDKIVQVDPILVTRKPTHRPKKIIKVKTNTLLRLNDDQKKALTLKKLQSIN